MDVTICVLASPPVSAPTRAFSNPQASSSQPQRKGRWMVDTGTTHHAGHEELDNPKPSPYGFIGVAKEGVGAKVSCCGSLNRTVSLKHVVEGEGPVVLNLGFALRAPDFRDNLLAPYELALIGCKTEVIPPEPPLFPLPCRAA